VHGASETTAGLSQQDLSAWYRTRKLWLWVGTGGNPQPFTRAGTGVAAPIWSANSQDILYVRNNALWLVPIFTASGDLPTAPALPVVSRLFAGNWPNLNGYTAWQSQFAWHS
jgi:Tol biopolymer transport system component